MILCLAVWIAIACGQGRTFSLIGTSTAALGDAVQIERDRRPLADASRRGVGSSASAAGRRRAFVRLARVRLVCPLWLRKCTSIARWNLVLDPCRVIQASAPHERAFVRVEATALP
jgi:hypothetical protein